MLFLHVFSPHDSIITFLGLENGLGTGSPYTNADPRWLKT